MALPALSHVYRYARPSALEANTRGARLHLATSSADRSQPYFFRGRVAAPRLLADLLLLVSRVAGARYHVPPGMLARLLRESDPVVTCDAGHVRFESLSACCGVYARVDAPHAFFEASVHARGTTNVDLNPETRAALATVGDTLEIAVGRDEVVLETGDARVSERRVTLPARWIRGFLEVQAYQARMRPCFELAGTGALRFVRALPRQRTRDAVRIARSGPGLRLTHVSSPGSMLAGGLERLRLLEPVAGAARSLAVFGEPQGASGWVLALPHDITVSLVLSPSVWRGFSGEGQALEALAGDAGEAASLRAALRWQGALDPAALGLSGEQATAALARLGAAGAVGFDLGAQRFFHRELPFDLAQVERLQPRLRDARALVDRDGVHLSRTATDRVEARVAGSDVEHRVRIDAGEARCTCPWYSRHRGARGPCKHILAVQIASQGQGEGEGDERDG